MPARDHRPFKAIAFNANGIWRLRYGPSKQLQNLHIDVAQHTETHLKPHERLFIPNYHFHQTDRFPRRKGIRHNSIDVCYICDTYI